MHTFKAHSTYQISGRGVVFCGPSPFEFQRDKSMDEFAGEWQIDHPDTNGKVFRVIGVESHCLLTIREGALIGLMVEERGQPNVAVERQDRTRDCPPRTAG